MTTATTAQVQAQFDKYIELAQQEPVFVVEDERRCAVLLSMAEYKQLCAADDSLWGLWAEQAKGEGMLTPEQTAAFLQEQATKAAHS